MQQVAFLLVKNQKIKVLQRIKKTAHCLKIRNSGSNGVYLADESIFLEEHEDLLQDLKAGKTITL